MPTHERTLELLARSGTVLAERLTSITPGEWDAATPCSEWTVRDLVSHIALAELAVRPMLRHESLQIDDEDLLGDAPARSCSDLVDVANEHFAMPSALSGTALHPFLGEIEAARLAMMRIVDRVIHGWDLAVATGYVPSLPIQFAEEILEIAEAREDQVPRGFLFGPRADVSPWADPVTRLVAIFGRNARWQPPHADRSDDAEG